MRLLLLIFFCWDAVIFAQGSDNFYFPDQLPAKADASSHAWTDGGNAHATSNAAANVGHVSPLNNPIKSHEPIFEPFIGGHDNHGGHVVGGDINQFPSNRPGHLPSGGYDGHEFGGGFNRYPPNQTTQLPSGGHGGHEFNGNFDQGYSTRPINPSFQSHPSFNGGGQSNAQANANAESNSEGVGNSKSTSNAQASSQNFANGNIISNAISNTQTNGPNGEASASAAAAAAGVTYVNGIPVATASAAASVASTAPGAGAISSSSSSGPQQIGPNFNSGFNSYREPYYGRAPYPGLNNRPNNGPNNIYDKPVGQQSWFYRSAWDKNDDEIEAHSIKVDQSETDRISKSPDIENVTVVKIPESKSGIVIFKD